MIPTPNQITFATSKRRYPLPLICTRTIPFATILPSRRSHLRQPRRRDNRLPIPIRDDLAESFVVATKSFAVLVAFACSSSLLLVVVAFTVVAFARCRRWSAPSSLKLDRRRRSNPSNILAPSHTDASTPFHQLFAFPSPLKPQRPFGFHFNWWPFAFPSNFFFFPNYFKYETPKIIFIYCFSTVYNTSHTHIQECIYFFDCVYLSKLLFLQKGKVGLCCVCLWPNVKWCVELWWWQSFHKEECVLVWRWGVLLMFERRMVLRWTGSGGCLWYIFFCC